MIYSKEQFIKEVEFMLKNDYTQSSIAKAIWEKYSDLSGQIDDELDSAMMTLIMMDEGDEFEMSNKEIQVFLKHLKSKSSEYSKKMDR